MNTNVMLTEEETRKIEYLIKKDVRLKDICLIMGRSPETIRRVAANLGYPSWYERKTPEDRVEIYKWLQKYWRWKRPKKAKKRKRSNFITPYSYPRLWDQEMRLS